MARSLKTDRQGPPAVFVDRDYLALIKQKKEAFTLTFAPSVWNASYSLVVDIYLSTRHTHPEGHIGWWLYHLNQKEDPLPVTIEKRGSLFKVVFQKEREADAKWVNKAALDVTQEGVLAVHLVLRNTENNALEYDSVLYLYLDPDIMDLSLARRSSSADNTRSIEGAIGRSYCWPRRSTIRVVAQDIRERDAIGSLAFDLRTLFTGNSMAAQLYANNFDPALRGFIRETGELPGDVRKDDLIFYNFSIFDPHFEAIAHLNVRKVMYYHNITPPRMLMAFSAEYGGLCNRAYQQLPLAHRFNTLLVNSHSTYREFRAILSQCPDTNGPESCPNDIRDRFGLSFVVCPPFLNGRKWDRVQEEALQLPVPFPKEARVLLFVGRVAPHKKIEDLFALFDSYNRLDPESVLVVVGNIVFEGYRNYLEYLLGKKYNHLRGRIHLVGDIGEGQLKHAYKRASAFVSMSEHEGFCVPLVEAMLFQKPVFAYAQEAVRETMAGTGRLFYEKNFADLASELHLLLKNKALLDEIIAFQDRRLTRLLEEANGNRIWQALEQAFFDARPF